MCVFSLALPLREGWMCLQEKVLNVRHFQTSSSSRHCTQEDLSMSSTWPLPAVIAVTGAVIMIRAEGRTDGTIPGLLAPRIGVSDSWGSVSAFMRSTRAPWRFFVLLKQLLSFFLSSREKHPTYIKKLKRCLTIYSSSSSAAFDENVGTYSQQSPNKIQTALMASVLNYFTYVVCKWDDNKWSLAPP